MAACAGGARGTASPGVTPLAVSTPVAPSASERADAAPPVARVLDFGPPDDVPDDSAGGDAVAASATISPPPPSTARPPTATATRGTIGLCHCAPRDFQCRMACANGGTAATAASVAQAGGTPAAATLGAIAANLASCKKAGGPTGPGKVKITFQPTGFVSAVELVDGAFSGTSVGGCILGKFHAAQIPPFGGAPVSANKSFVL